MKTKEVKLPQSLGLSKLVELDSDIKRLTDKKMGKLWLRQAISQEIYYFDELAELRERGGVNLKFSFNFCFSGSYKNHIFGFVNIF